MYSGGAWPGSVGGIGGIGGDGGGGRTGGGVGGRTGGGGGGRRTGGCGGGGGGRTGVGGGVELVLTVVFVEIARVVDVADLVKVDKVLVTVATPVDELDVRLHFEHACFVCVAVKVLIDVAWVVVVGTGESIGVEQCVAVATCVLVLQLLVVVVEHVPSEAVERRLHRSVNVGRNLHCMIVACVP